jgi:simple sugar transport system ATP-binding protein
MAILFISSELEETVRSSSRVIVLRDREQAGELDEGNISEASIMRVIAGRGGAD